MTVLVGIYHRIYSQFCFVDAASFDVAIDQVHEVDEPIDLNDDVQLFFMRACSGIQLDLENGVAIPRNDFVEGNYNVSNLTFDIKFTALNGDISFYTYCGRSEYMFSKLLKSLKLRDTYRLFYKKDLRNIDNVFVIDSNGEVNRFIIGGSKIMNKLFQLIDCPDLPFDCTSGILQTNWSQDIIDNGEITKFSRVKLAHEPRQLIFIEHDDHVKFPMYFSCRSDINFCQMHLNKIERYADLNVSSKMSETQMNNLFKTSTIGFNLSNINEISWFGSRDDSFELYRVSITMRFGLVHVYIFAQTGHHNVQDVFASLMENRFYRILYTQGQIAFYTMLGVTEML